MGDVETLKQAVAAVYSPTSTERVRSEANAWLMSFSASQEAWAAARTLLSEPDEQIQYFGANLLFMKVRSEWHGLPEAAKAQILGVVKELVGQISTSAPPGWIRLSQASKRLCLVLAAAAVRSNALESFANDALELAKDQSGRGASVAIELLIALPQELLEKSAAQAGGKAPLPELRGLLPTVFQLLVSALEYFGSGSGSENAECVIPCLRCLQQWLSLEMGYSLVTLMDTCPTLLQRAMSALSSSHDPLVETAADALVSLLSPMNTALSPSVERSVTITHAMAEQMKAIAASLRLPEAALAEYGTLSERQYHFCRVLCAFGERAVDVVAQTSGDLLPLVELLFLCLNAELRVADLSIEFWSGIQNTPVAQRHAQLGEPLYRELQARVLLKCTLPPEFTSWEEEVNLEEDDFERFREQSASELLDACMQLLKNAFTSTLHAKLEPGAGGAPPSWQQLELVYFVTRVLHAELKAILSAQDDAHGADPAAAQRLAAHKGAIKSLLVSLLTPIAEGSLNDQPPPVRSSAVRLVGNFGKLLASEHTQLLEGCVHYVLNSLLVPTAAEHAAVAFRALCVHAQKQLGRYDTVLALLRVCEPAMRNGDLTADLRIALSEGLARLVAALPARGRGGEEPARSALQALLAPPCSLLQTTLAQGASIDSSAAAGWLRESSESVATQVLLIGSSIRFCDGFKLVHTPEAPHPVLTAMESGVWNLLMQAANMFCTQSNVMQAMCEVYSKMMAVLKVLMRPLLPQLLHSLSASFTTTPIVGVLTTLRDAIEMYGREDDDDLAQALGAVMTTLIESICQWLSSTKDPEAQPELLTAFWEMCHRCLVFRPGLLLTLPCAPTLFEAAVASVRHQEFQHTRAVLTFICLFMCPTDSANPYRETSVYCIQSYGKWLLRECLSGLAAISPDNLVDHQVELMRVLIEACPSAVATWLKELLSNPEGLTMGSVDPQGKTMQAFAALVLQQPALAQTEFQCVASDFSRICRGKLGPESLDRYLVSVGP